VRKSIEVYGIESMVNYIMWLWKQYGSSEIGSKVDCIPNQYDENVITIWYSI
jgi:hypothetical protein